MTSLTDQKFQHLEAFESPLKTSSSNDPKVLIPSVDKAKEAPNGGEPSLLKTAIHAHLENCTAKNHDELLSELQERRKKCESAVREDTLIDLNEEDVHGPVMNAELKSRLLAEMQKSAILNPEEKHEKSVNIANLLKDAFKKIESSLSKEIKEKIQQRAAPGDAKDIVKEKDKDKTPPLKELPVKAKNASKHPDYFAVHGPVSEIIQSKLNLEALKAELRRLASKTKPMKSSGQKADRSKEKASDLEKKEVQRSRTAKKKLHQPTVTFENLPDPADYGLKSHAETPPASCLKKRKATADKLLAAAAHAANDSGSRKPRKMPESILKNPLKTKKAINELMMYAAEPKKPKKKKTSADTVPKEKEVVNPEVEVIHDQKKLKKTTGKTGTKRENLNEICSKVGKQQPQQQPPSSTKKAKASPPTDGGSEAAAITKKQKVLIDKYEESSNQDAIFDYFITKIAQKSFKGDVKLSRQAASVVSSFVFELLQRLCNEATQCLLRNGRNRLTQKDIEAAIRVVFPDLMPDKAQPTAVNKMDSFEAVPLAAQ